MRIRRLMALGALALLPAVAVARPPAPPGGTVVLPAELGAVELWPYTGTTYSGNPSDPVNLLFGAGQDRGLARR